jgi:hypothetical protein
MVESAKNKQGLAVGDYKHSLRRCTYVRDVYETSSFRGFRLKILLLGDYNYFWTSFEGLLKCSSTPGICKMNSVASSL